MTSLCCIDRNRLSRISYCKSVVYSRSTIQSLFAPVKPHISFSCCLSPPAPFYSQVVFLICLLWRTTLLRPKSHRTIRLGLSKFPHDQPDVDIGLLCDPAQFPTLILTQNSPAISIPTLRYLRTQNLLALYSPAALKTQTSKSEPHYFISYSIHATYTLSYTQIDQETKSLSPPQSFLNEGAAFKPGSAKSRRTCVRQQEYHSNKTRSLKDVNWSRNDCAKPSEAKFFNISLCSGETRPNSSFLALVSPLS